VELYHTGIVVEDLHPAMAEFSAALDLRWRPVSDRELPMWTPAGVLPFRIRRVYSESGPPHLEMIEAVPDRIWALPEGSRSALHHLGYCSDDVAAVAAHLEQAGLIREISDVNPGGFNQFTYHRVPGGLFVELVTTRFRERLTGRGSAP
jgi:hypothetical protein